MELHTHGIAGLLILIGDIWAIVSIVSSPVGTGSKVLWILLVVILPVVGLLLWFFLGPRSQTTG